jgi:hypothetical protein
MYASWFDESISSARLAAVRARSSGSVRMLDDCADSSTYMNASDAHASAYAGAAAVL